jgi:hypothetical protein
MANYDPLETAYYDFVGQRALSGFSAVDELWDELNADLKAEGFPEIAHLEEQNSGTAARSLHQIIQGVSAEVKSDFEKTGLPIRTATYAGAYPTGSFNAQAVIVQEGVLVLVNTGLHSFILEVLVIMMHSAIFKNFETDTVSAKGQLARPLSRAELVLALAELVVAYTAANSAWLGNCRQLPRPGGVRTILLAMVARWCEKFVLAHEYAHVVAGHLSASQTVKVPTPAGEVEFAAKSRIEEFQADQIALGVILKSPEFDRSDPITPRIATAGVLLSFALAELIERTATSVQRLYGFTSMSDHPPTSDRREVLTNEIIRLEGPGIVDMGTGFASWLRSASDEVVALLDKAAPSDL